MLTKLLNYSQTLITNKATYKNKFFKSMNELAFSKKVGLGLIGIGLGGFTYLILKLKYPDIIKKEEYVKLPHSIAQSRTKVTLMYLASGLLITTSLTFAMQHSSLMLNYAKYKWTGLVVIPPTLILFYKLQTSESQNVLKHIYWILFNTVIAFSIHQIITISRLKIITDVLFLANKCLWGLGVVALNSEHWEFLNMSGILGAALGGLVAIGIANIILKSHALYNIRVLGGAALFTIFVIFDLSKLVIEAESKKDFDPLGESVDVYLDIYNVIIRALSMIFGLGYG
jgi:FtsH-binding integral membrane protein